MSWVYDTDLAASFTINVYLCGNVYNSYIVSGSTFNYAVTGLTPDQGYDFAVIANGVGTASSQLTEINNIAAPAEALFASGPTFVDESGIGLLTVSNGSRINWSIL